MLDCGLKPSVLERKLFDLNIPISSVEGVLITHEHQDHIKGYKSVRRGITAYATGGTLNFIEGNNKVHITPGKMFKVGSFKVVAFKVPHDAADPVNYIIQNSVGEYFVYITDTGDVTLKLNVSPKMVLIEANYEEEYVRNLLNNAEKVTNNELRARIPLYRRLMGTTGHLSWQKTAKILRRMDLTNCEKVILCHISKHNTRHIQTLIDFIKDRVDGKHETIALHQTNTNITTVENKNPF